jgi:hypothetical protein
MKKSIFVIVILLGILILVAINLLQTQQELAHDQQLQEIKGTEADLMLTLSSIETQAAIDPPPLTNHFGKTIWVTVPIPLP